MRVGKQVEDRSYVYPAMPIYITPDSDIFTRVDTDPDFVAELKKNGWRCMVRKKEDGKIELWTRHHTLINDELPNLRAKLAALDIPNDTILDGELMEHRGKVKEELNVFGAIRLGGKWLSALSYGEVIKVVDGLIKESVHIKKAKQFKSGMKGLYKEIEEEFLACSKRGEMSVNEGLVLKSLKSPVPFGWGNCPSHKKWFKVKPVVLCDGLAR